MLFADFNVPQWVRDYCEECTMGAADAMPSFRYRGFIFGCDAEDVDLSEYGRNENGCYYRFPVYADIGDGEIGDLLAEFETFEQALAFMTQQAEGGAA